MLKVCAVTMCMHGCIPLSLEVTSSGDRKVAALGKLLGIGRGFVLRLLAGPHFESKKQSPIIRKRCMLLALAKHMPFI
jgi:hypothetical protein